MTHARGKRWAVLVALMLPAAACSDGSSRADHAARDGGGSGGASAHSSPDSGSGGGAGAAHTGSGGRGMHAGSGGHAASASDDAGSMQAAADAAAQDAATPMSDPLALDPACDGDSCHYVLAGASGNADGSDWTNAWTALPDTLQRGHYYFIGDGEYPSYQFDDPADSAMGISVLRATPAIHGTDVGWQAAHADGVAQFAPLEFMSPHVGFYGQGAHSVIVRGDFQGAVVHIGADSVSFWDVEVDGAFAADGSGKHVGGACTGIDVGASMSVNIGDCEIHDVADDGVSISDATDFVFGGNVVHALHACGSDGGCGPCYNGHSDGIEAYHVTHAIFVRNLIYDVRSTSTFFFGNWADSLGNGPSDYCSDITLQNNIFYAPEVGLVAYIQDVVGIDVFHNVFWGKHQGGYGGLSVGQHVKGLRLYDNVILSINYDHVGATFDAAEHHGDYNLFGISLGQWTDAAHDVVATDPKFAAIPDVEGAAVSDPKPEDFAPLDGSPCIDKGTSDPMLPPPDVDFFGHGRVAEPDIGAIEHP